MPQLDVFPYFSQFVYFLISFIAVYVLSLTIVLPQLVAILKIRQKLNSLVRLSSKLALADKDTYIWMAEDKLITTNWYNRCKLTKMWILSARMQQIAEIMRLKKLDCYPMIQCYTLDDGIETSLPRVLVKFD